MRRFRTPGDSEASRALEADGENIRAAMEWASDTGLPVLFADLGLAWGTALQRRGFQAEAVGPIQAGLEAIRPLRDAHPALYANLLRARAGLHFVSLSREQKAKLQGWLSKKIEQCFPDAVKKLFERA